MEYIVSCLLTPLSVHDDDDPFIVSVQMTDTDVALLLYYKPCPYDRHDLYLPSIIPASLQTLGRCAGVSARRLASALAPHGAKMATP